MLDDKRDVIESDSPADKKNDIPPHRGQDGVDRSFDNLLAENQRKAEKIVNLESRLSQLEEIENDRQLTATEQRDKASLQSDIDNLAQQVKNTDNGKIWLHLTKKEMASEFERRLRDYSIERGDAFLEDKAIEEGIENAMALANKLAPHAKPYMHLSPERRDQLAFRDWKKSTIEMENIKKREDEIKKKEDEMKSYAEGRGRSTRDPSFEEKLNKSTRAGERVSLARDLVDKASEQLR